ncbi:hypothetical protein TCDM_00995 [Trypanosoma cruzi Dm28c]|uniref:Uncharacterized protein n=1 Tax=Trypanosoma cruzi Dm28c TaxID=1416333 RepID=V5BAA3_TRYCR|nr:hypothetical protein TCDM_00995 [Trypanosoma cruzi Dm28c]
MTTAVKAGGRRCKWQMGPVSFSFFSFFFFFFFFFVCSLCHNLFFFYKPTFPSFLPSLPPLNPFHIFLLLLFTIKGVCGYLYGWDRILSSPFRMFLFLFVCLFGGALCWTSASVYIYAFAFSFSAVSLIYLFICLFVGWLFSSFVLLFFWRM